jgi:hypothetical protein
MTTQELNEIKERAEKVVQFRDSAKNPAPVEVLKEWLVRDGYREDWSSLAAHSTDDIPALLAEVERLTKERDAAVEQIQHYPLTCKHADNELTCDIHKQSCMRMECQEWEWKKGTV